ncbi:MAG TPA: L-threonylcarbamoyladenylate synthase [Planctomycetota bacterium]|nr:L-threonylcarbamoyladenylate synthase [Planctomycetota bacterium]
MLTLPQDAILSAIALLNAGEVVAFPTETVYGLGADASNPDAVAKIFALKSRPRNHPLIVHLADAECIEQWAREIPDEAWELAREFWPGPLTLILKRSTRVLDAVTGGQDSIGLRVPAHPVALALLHGFGGGVAAPSANRFGAVSPTAAEHVRAEFGDLLPMILDGGLCSVGVESTILDLSPGTPALLRPGGVTKEALERVLKLAVPLKQSGVRAPGQMASHYAPRAEVILTTRAEAAEREAALRAAGKKVARLGELIDEHDMRAYARRLYAALRAADTQGADVLLATLPDERGLGLAIADRLRKAAGPRGRMTSAG